MPYRPDDFGIFTTPDRATIQVDLKKINGYLFNFSKNTGITDFIAYDEVLFEVIERVEKRRVYFHIFYDGCNMGEINEVSLICFWILKLTPFFSRTIPSSELNAKIALHIFVNMLTYVQNSEKKQVNINRQIMDDLYYAFLYRDLSKEAVMLLAESLIYDRKS
jgi:hypothetical protein